jgi:outer membrane protein TolC
MKLLLSITLTLFFNYCYLQNADSIITYSNYIQNIIKFHPLIQKYNIETVQKSRAYITKSRGFFDPKVYYNFDQKLFQTKNYYSIINGGLKIPSWFGTDFKAEYNYNTGLYINSSEYLPPNGLWSLGFSQPILKNLFIDERRWLLKSSKIDLQIAELEFNQYILQFLIDASYRYWEWFEQYNRYLLLDYATQISRERLKATENAVIAGDLAPIDTTETSIQYNNFLIQKNIAEIELNNVKNNIQYFLQWDKNQFNFSLNYPFYPERFNPSNIKNLIFDKKIFDSLIYQHPAYKKYLFKNKTLQIEKRFRIEMLKPQLDITYNALLLPIHPNDLYYNSNNYKWGINFSLPVFLRKERAELKLINLKLRENQIESELKFSELFIKATNYFNLYTTYSNQLVNIESLIQRYEKMLNAERDKFFAGESSVFLVNARENYLIDAKLKQISFYAKLNLYKSLLELSLGQIPQ